MNGTCGNEYAVVYRRLQSRRAQCPASCDAGYKYAAVYDGFRKFWLLITEQASPGVENVSSRR